MIKNAMTVDVEDYFQVSAFERYIKREEWDNLPCRVENNTNRILDMFSSTGIKGTFFVLGWVAERYPQLVRRVVKEGHELASHGYNHIRVTEQTAAEFRVDIKKTKALLEDIAGCQVRGYRAASYSICGTNLWALEELQEAGYDYSSSIYPVYHDIYGMPDAPRFSFWPNGEDGLVEIPITTYEFMKFRIPCGGGGYFRLLPYPLSKRALQGVNNKDKKPGIFYFHPWEIDPEQPRQKRIDLKTRFRHYTNLQQMEGKLRRLLEDFSWGRMDTVFSDDINKTGSI